jgi:uncharacterized damage-inducible protein DinB
MSTESKWTRRRFDFNFPVELFPEILERLRGTPARLEDRLRSIPHSVLVRKKSDHWSIQEHAGHLLDLEALTLGRFDDFESGVAVLRPADMENQRTYEARHNEKPLGDILRAFRSERERMTKRLELWPPGNFSLTAIHPRLNVTMRAVDLMFFHAEHDDNHMARITALLNDANTKAH